MISSWPSGQKIWHWRVRGRSSDRQIVTLGKYDTKDEAKVDRDRIVKERFYRNVRIERIVATHVRMTWK